MFGLVGLLSAREGRSPQPEAAGQPVRVQRGRAAGGREGNKRAAKRGFRVECSKTDLKFFFRKAISKTAPVPPIMKMPAFARFANAFGSKTGRKPDEPVERSKIAINWLGGNGLQKRRPFYGDPKSSGFVRSVENRRLTVGSSPVRVGRGHDLARLWHSDCDSPSIERPNWLILNRFGHNRETARPNSHTGRLGEPIMSLHFKRVLAIAAVMSPVAQSIAATPYDTLLSRVPENANVLLVFDSEAMQKSPLAQREEWGKNYKKSALGGMFGAPPYLQKVVIASQMNHATLENQWEAAICKLRYDVKLQDIRDSVKGVRDSVGGQEIILTPQNSFIVPFTGSQLGMMRPANRQAVGRWIRGAGGDRATLSPYLRESLERMPRDAQAQIAFDLADVCDLEGLRLRLKKSKALSESGIDVETAAKLFCGMRGMTLSMRVDERITGELRIDFDELPTFLAPVAKNLVEEALAGIGAAIEDLDNWETKIEGKAIVLRGNLSINSARKIVSPLLKPIPVVIGSMDQADRQSLSSEAAASVRYFNAVNTLLNDLKATKTRSLTDRSFWYRQFAEKIDALPVLNVDDELLKYGASMSTTLRSLANLAVNSALQKKEIALNTYEYTVVLPWSNYYYLYGPGWSYGYSVPMIGTYSNYGLAQNLIARVGSTEAAIRNETWKNIDAATVEIRNKMTQKYRTEFK